jgi:cytosine/adenosine deaminase-related metal-dependent hydrolase
MDQELVEYLDNRFLSVDRQFQELRGDIQGLRGEMHGLRAEMNERLEEVKRHSGVLVEGLGHELRLVAERLMTHIDVRHAEDKANVDQRFNENNSLIRLCFESTEQLRQRVENLERERPN